ncbi:MAG: peptidase S9, partial [Vulcanococcus sp.]
MSSSPIRSGVPLSAALVLGKTPSLKEPCLLGDRLYWLEQRPQEKGRTTLMGRPVGGGEPQEHTPGAWNLRCRVHEYGGGSCALGLGEDGRPVAVFVHD